MTSEDPPRRGKNVQKTIGISFVAPFLGSPGCGGGGSERRRIQETFRWVSYITFKSHLETEENFADSNVTAKVAKHQPIF
ncbi:hypothetical protein L596_008688 [Steinernema carpocapsae]|uniref:Uncharacterized protein n=1 Tax=Steinernema carpocapsae TaxID=34508 RepID=A0A4U5PDS1_STECR|nr:hypothetical protein L596_008688 [Steinernema carpocapsae]